MSDEKTFLIVNQPGIRRDGTSIDSNQYNDGQWVRFSREAGRPKKMGGYRSVTGALDGPSRGAFTWNRDGFTYLISFSDVLIQQLQLDKDGLGSSIVDRTPLFGMIARHDDYSWQADIMYDAAAGSHSSTIFVHPGRNLTNIDNSITSRVYYANSYDPYGPSTFPVFADLSVSVDVSGGIVCISPFLVAYGSDGLVMWSNENEPANFTTGSAGTARITGSKIVRGLPLRGGSQSPAALLWSLDSVFRMYYIGGTAIFKFDPISSQSSVLSSNGIIEYDGTYYWAGIDRFLVYNGTVQELPCNSHLNFFYDNLNYNHRQKVWVTKVPRHGEIWWHFPKGDSTECNHALIYNVRQKCWYDTEISRAAGCSPSTFHRPLWLENSTYTAKAWVHEEGWDKSDGEVVSAIPSFFETADFGFPTGGSDSEKNVGANRWTRVTRVEPDFVMSGNMTMEVVGQDFAQSDVKVSEPFTFDKNSGKIDMREQRREIRLRFSSNDLGGTYDAGKIIMHLDVGDVRS